MAFVPWLSLAAALGCSALSTVAFLLAPDVGVLIVGRILSGLSAGLMTGSATAALTELAGRRPGRKGARPVSAARPAPGRRAAPGGADRVS